MLSRRCVVDAYVNLDAQTDHGNEFEIVGELPGFNKQDVSIDVDENSEHSPSLIRADSAPDAFAGKTLSIAGKRKVERREGGSYRSEFGASIVLFCPSRCAAGSAAHSCVSSAQSCVRACVPESYQRSMSIPENVDIGNIKGECCPKTHDKAAHDHLSRALVF